MLQKVVHNCYVVLDELRYEKNTNVDVILRSLHPAPATLRAVSWEGDYSPKYYKRV